MPLRRVIIAHCGVKCAKAIASLVSRAQRSTKCCAAEPGSRGSSRESWAPDLRRTTVRCAASGERRRDLAAGLAHMLRDPEFSAPREHRYSGLLSARVLSIAVRE